MQRFYECEIITPAGKTESLSGWYNSHMLEAIAEIEKELKRGYRLRSNQRIDSKGKKE